MADEVDPQLVAAAEREYERGRGEGPFGMTEIAVTKSFRFNPVVSLFGALCLWWLVIWVIVDDEAGESFAEGQTWVTEVFTWLYIFSQDYWLFYLIPLVYYYGDVKLGKDDEKPEYGDFTYFGMVFFAGVAIGFVFYGASEPAFHMVGGNRYTKQGFMNDNQIAQNAINITIYHWGVQAWVVYAITAVSMGFLSYRKGLPLCFRSTLAPLLGRATWGYLGDILDVVTIVTIVAGLCTSLGIGATQIVTGCMRMGIFPNDLLDEANESAYKAWIIGVIAVITCGATLSVVSGVNIGIKILSGTALVLSFFMLFACFLMDQPWYSFNVITQSLGFHIQHWFELSFHCDAFAQLKAGQGKASDGKGAASAWMDWWTIFYWGWWIAWAPFVGTFLARISRGRTIRNVIAFSLTIPFLYCVCWFSTFGGNGIRMHRRALEMEAAGAAKHDFGSTWRNPKAGDCFDVIQLKDAKGVDYGMNLGLSPVCKFSSSDGDGFWFDLMNQYYGFGDFFIVLSVIFLILGFITSSDSGSLVVDLIAANGREAHVVQRVFWALSEGAVAIALFAADGTKTLKSLRALSIMAGLPFTVIMMMMCTALWRALKIDQGHMKPRQERVDWKLPLYGGVFDILNCTLDWQGIQLFFVGLACPPLCMYMTLGDVQKIEEKGTKNAAGLNKIIFAIFTGITYYLWVILIILSLAKVDEGMAGMAWASFTFFAMIVAVARQVERKIYTIEGNIFEDFFASLFLWPQVLAQMVLGPVYPPERTEPQSSLQPAIQPTDQTTFL